MDRRPEQLRRPVRQPLAQLCKQAPRQIRWLLSKQVLSLLRTRSSPYREIGNCASGRQPQTAVQRRYSCQVAVKRWTSFRCLRQERLLNSSSCNRNISRRAYRYCRPAPDPYSASSPPHPAHKTLICSSIFQRATCRLPSSFCTLWCTTQTK